MLLGRWVTRAYDILGRMNCGIAAVHPVAGGVISLSFFYNLTDVIAFTAGVGENDKLFRAGVLEGMEFLGIKFDASKNNVRGEEAVISADDSKVKVVVIPTDEELMIATDTMNLLK